MRPSPTTTLLAVLILGVATPPRTAPAQAPAAEPKAVAGPPAPLIEQPTADYKARRKALMKRVKEADAAAGVGGIFGRRRMGSDGAEAVKPRGPLIVLVGETDEPEDARYRQTNPFAYLTGVETPHAALILSPDDEKEVLYLPPRDRMEEAWTGPKIGPGPEGVAATGFDRVEPSTGFMGDLFAAIGDAGKRSFAGGRPSTVYLLSPDPKPSLGGPSAGLARTVKEGAPLARTRDVAPFLAELRKVKSAAEVALLRRAIAVTGDAQAAVTKLLAPGLPEYRLEGAILGAFVSGGAQRAGFPSIVGSGLNSTVLHYNANRRTMQAGDLVVVDIGAEYFLYTADITRTYPVNGKFTPRQREVYRLVLDCQSAVAAGFRTGQTSLPAQNMLAIQFLQSSPMRARDERGVEHTMDHFFIHGLGHYLGMDVHDVGDVSTPMQPGEVFTIEPGIYIPSEGFGVRIEDDYLVTKDGLEKLSKDIPSDPDAIERLLEAARSPRPAATSARADAIRP